MKKLILIRHAKSCWETIVDDKNRPISRERGVLDAHLVFPALREYLPKKFVAWTSTARRAKQTAIVFCQILDVNNDYVIAKDEVYTFELKKLEKAIKSCGNNHNALIIFGHNEAITDFVNKFGDVSIKNVPTCGVVVMKFDQDRWEDIENGNVIKTIFPRDLK